MIRWKPIAGHPDYKISSAGKVMSCRPRNGRRGDGTGKNSRQRTLKNRRKKSGHLAVVLSNSTGKRKNHLIHRLVLEAFVGPCPDGMECRHLNGDPGDNRLENLCWGTHADNMRDKVKHGTSTAGERNPCARLRLPDVLRLRRIYAHGKITVSALAREEKLPRSTVYDVVTRVKWRHV